MEMSGPRCNDAERITLAPSGELASFERDHAGLIADARVLLAAVVAGVVVLQPEGVDRLQLGTVLVPYLTYAIVVRRQVMSGRENLWSNMGPWIDLACYTALSGLSGGRFLMFLLYPIAVASFNYGLKRGLQMGFGCMFLLVGIEAVQADFFSDPHVQTLSPGPLIVLITVAIMIARWAHAEATLTRRLAFTSDLNQFFHPNSSLDHAAGSLAWALRMHQKADSCLLIINDAVSGQASLYVADARDAKPVKVERIDEQLTKPLLALPPGQASFYRRSRLPWRAPLCWGYDLASLEACQADPAALSAVANLLESRCFMSLPVRSRNQTVGRCYLSSSKLRYAREDVRFVSHLIGQAGVMIENMRLLDRMSLEAAKQERRKISLDLHDGTIQPYIGLKLGLEALQRRIRGEGAISHEVDELIHMAGEGISQLRRYVGDLKSTAPDAPRVYVLPAVRLQAEKFSRYYSIVVEVTAEQDIAVERPLYEEIIQIVREALSNIRRHTSATRVRIILQVEPGRLSLRFTNDGCMVRETPERFCPHSIEERTKQLGGRVTVENRSGEHTVVLVELPL